MDDYYNKKRREAALGQLALGLIICAIAGIVYGIKYIFGI
jgi:hypothetical protein